MSSKIGLIISMLFFSIFFFLCIDVITIQFFYSDLDAKSVPIAYEISHQLEITDEYIKELEEKYNITISNISTREPVFGDMVNYTLERSYQPIIVSRDILVIKIKRTAVIGYY